MHTVGTLRKNRKGIPKEITSEKLNKDYREQLVYYLLGLELKTDGVQPKKAKHGHVIKETEEKCKRNRKMRKRCTICYQKVSTQQGSQVASRLAKKKHHKLCLVIKGQLKSSSCVLFSFISIITIAALNETWSRPIGNPQEKCEIDPLEILQYIFCGEDSENIQTKMFAFYELLESADST
ncbi:hypothetical protein NQ315_000445 [Exocentrus adspersus]|uniref:Uncharacterized protein n=1 Tax=Exocentrus adspersus TaxID=1586481 RepID=A0AAV8V604_9CUCU|nr:hypothetical protein NQ315_000445 [Exocentrus adspersus]